jgi:enamine deaminase RidA (YjgF/YER057c/UK114 family)
MTIIKWGVWLLMLGFFLPCAAQSPEKKLEELGIKIPQGPSKANNYLTGIASGKIIYLSGKGAVDEHGKYITGKLGGQMTTQQGKQAARRIAASFLIDLKTLTGDLSRIKQILKVTGYINSEADYTGQSALMDGFSDVMVQVLGDAGKHARSSIGVNSLPGGMAMEIEMIVEIR